MVLCGDFFVQSVDIDFDACNRNYWFYANIFSYEKCVNYDNCASWNWRGVGQIMKIFSGSSVVK